MDVDSEAWFLVLQHGSMMSKTWGAYKLKTIMNCSEMKILPQCSKC